MLLMSLTFLVGCGGQATIPVTVIRMTATGPAITATPAPPTATAASPAEPSTPQPEPPTAAAEPTLSEAGTRVTFRFVTTLSTVEEVGDIRDLLHDTEGILAVTGDEISITIAYDPAILTVDQVMAIMAQIGYPVNPPEG
jgi:hypothetical protein